MSFADVMQHAGHREAIGAAVLLVGQLSGGRGPRRRGGRGELPSPAALVRRGGPTGAGGPGKRQTSRAPSPVVPAGEDVVVLAVLHPGRTPARRPDPDAGCRLWLVELPAVDRECAQHHDERRAGLFGGLSFPWLVGARGGSCEVRDMTDQSETTGDPGGFSLRQRSAAGVMRSNSSGVMAPLCSRLRALALCSASASAATDRM